MVTKGNQKERENSTMVAQRAGAQKGNGASGVFEHIVPSYAWQIDVKASVNDTWQTSPFCHMLLIGAVVLDGTNGQHGHFSHAQRDCIEAF